MLGFNRLTGQKRLRPFGLPPIWYQGGQVELRILSASASSPCSSAIFLGDSGCLLIKVCRSPGHVDSPLIDAANLRGRLEELQVLVVLFSKAQTPVGFKQDHGLTVTVL